MAEKRILKPIEATISVEIDLHAPDRRKRDIDNTIKPTLDALQKAGLILDDNQIACLLVTRKVIMAQGQIIVRIKPYDCISGPS
jgi:crossover junction endodeoxyribonuclease RusA